MRSGTTPVAPVDSGDTTLDDPSLYFNRELSLLEFQKRVLEEALDLENKLLERVKFLSIVSSNLDEFFMVRMAALKQKLVAKSGDLSIDGETVEQQIENVRDALEPLVRRMYECLHRELIPQLEQQGIIITDYASLDERERAAVNGYYGQTIFPVLTPLGFDPSRPFPHISNLSVNLAVLLKDSTARFARVKVPDSLPQLVSVPAPPGKRKTAPPVQKFVWIEQVIAANLESLFPGWEIAESHPFHVTRDAEVAIKELESDDLLETVEEAVWRRRFRKPVRIQTDSAISEYALSILLENLGADEEDVDRVPGPLDLTRLRQLTSLDRPDLKDQPFEPATPAWFRTAAFQPDEPQDIFAVIREQDRIEQHPYQSFQPVVDLLRTAAHDPEVLAIKMTLYRVGRNAPVVQALLEAIENGKQVAVMVELKARFDEESNIEWARALEREGVHVVYGLVGMKVHCKILLIVRREHDGIRRYLHLGTGNYNATTARLYTDLSFFTCNSELGADATDLFNSLTGYSKKSDYRKLLVAPVTLRDRIVSLIRREIAHGAAGRLIFKMNALEDKQMIRLLYEASRAGVRVDLIVRGLCCLRPGLPGISENITVRSIVGRFLEHSRIYYFHNGGAEEVYSGSADLMPRNLDHRVELLFPVPDAGILRYLRDVVLEKLLEDNRNVRIGQPDGRYQFSPAAAAEGLDCQQWFIDNRAG